MKRAFALFGLLAVQASVAADAEWQTLSTQPSADNKKCEMRIPAGWTLQEKGASFAGPFAATLIYEAEKPEVWWAKRKKVDIKDSRVFQDTKTNYWIEVQGALLSGSEEGSVHIAGVRADSVVCHAVLEFKSDKWRDNYDEWQKHNGDMVRQMLTSMKPM
jgi:hypothetical protein